MAATDDKAFIFGTIFSLANRLQQVGDRMDPDLTVKQWLFVAAVFTYGGAPPTLSAIAARTGTSRQNAKKTAAILQRQGFLQLEADPTDARIRRITLTDACRAHLRGREEAETRFIDTLFSGFDDEELAAFSKAIGKLNRRANEIKEGQEKNAEENKEEE